MRKLELYLSVCLAFVILSSLILNYLLLDYGNVLPKEPVSIPKFIDLKWKHSQHTNLLSEEMSDASEISTNGWWMPHARWDSSVKCYNEDWAICSRVMSVQCKSDSVRAIYQYFQVRKDAQLRAVKFTLRAQYDSLLPFEDEFAVHSLSALIRMSKGSVGNISVNFPNTTHQFLQKSSVFQSINTESIVAVTLMLSCFGHSGEVQFADVQVEPVVWESTIFTSGKDIVSVCPENFSLPKLPPNRNYFKVEVIQEASFPDSQRSSITLVTQLSLDRLSVFVGTLKYWKGPVSVVIFVAETSRNADTSKDWVPIYIRKKMPNFFTESFNSALVVYGKKVSDPYPINFMRNLAFDKCRTKHALLIDGDFQPSTNFREHFDEEIKKWHQTKNIAFVIPAFEYLDEEEVGDPPQTKDELISLVKSEMTNLVPFRSMESPESHQSSEYERWYVSRTAYKIQDGYHDKYEPYIIVEKSRNFPAYNEHFSGYGMNKITHILELFAAGFQFWVLPSMWCVHLPHPVTLETQVFLRDAESRLKNRALRFDFISDMMLKYRVGSCSRS